MQPVARRPSLVAAEHRKTLLHFLLNPLQESAHRKLLRRLRVQPLLLARHCDARRMAIQPKLANWLGRLVGLLGIFSLVGSIHSWQLWHLGVLNCQFSCYLPISVWAHARHFYSGSVIALAMTRSAFSGPPSCAPKRRADAAALSLPGNLFLAVSLGHCQRETWHRHPSVMASLRRFLSGRLASPDGVEDSDRAKAGEQDDSKRV